RLTALEELNLDSNQITGTGLRHLAGLERLRRLNLNFNPLRPDSLATLATMRGLTHLSLLDAFPADDRALELCARLTDLEELHLPENTAAVTDRGLDHLSRLKRLKNLELSGARAVTDAGLARLAELAQLRDVSLRDLRSLTPRGTDVLGKLTELRRLHID